MRGVRLFDRGPLMGWQRRRTVVLFQNEKNVNWTFGLHPFVGRTWPL